VGKGVAGRRNSTKGGAKSGTTQRVQEAAAKSFYKECGFQGEGPRTVASFPIINIPIIISSQFVFSNMFS